MKKTILLFLSITVLLIAFAGCNSNEAQSKKSGASDSVSVALKPDYYPQNTFSDVDSDYAYFAVAKSIYKKSRSEDKSSQYKSIFHADNRISSLAVWREYVYFLSNGNLCRINNDGKNYQLLIPDKDLKDKDSGLSVCYMRIAGDKLYVDVTDFFDGYRIYDLTQSDTAQVFVKNTGTDRSSTPLDALCENWKYITEEHDKCYAPNEITFMLDAINAHFKSSAESITVVPRRRALFDYQSGYVLEDCGDHINVYGFGGTLIKDMKIINYDENYQYRIYQWGNASNGKAYRFAYPTNPDRSDPDKYSIIVYHIETEKEQIINMPVKYKIAGLKTDFDIVDDLLYWRNDSDDLICCDPADNSVESVKLN